MEDALKQRVRRRAKDVCEYCRMPQRFDVRPLQIDHVIAQKHYGTTVSENLALACYDCNLYKGPNVAGVDPQTDNVERLYHPRQDRWEEHFVWDGPRLVGRTPVGRTTVACLAINAQERVVIRGELIADGLFPPPPGDSGAGS